MRVIGIDEAGYGPLLGPLVVGSVSLECRQDRYDPEKLWRALGAKSGIADSKVVLSHRDMKSGEESTLAVLALAGVEVTTRKELFDKVLVPPPELAIDHLGVMSTASDSWACTETSIQARKACEPDEREMPRWGATPSSERVEDLRQRFEDLGIKVASARAIAVCPGLFNRAVMAGMSKLLLDWKLFARLLALDRAELEPDGFAACGKLGGRSRYGALLMDLGFSSVIEESRARSAYDLTDLGRVEFIRHAEAAHPPVAMASMIAKVVREHLLDQWHQMLSSAIPGLERCSGYRDPVTKRYVAQTAEARAELGIPDECFLRRK